LIFKEQPTYQPTPPKYWVVR